MDEKLVNATFAALTEQRDQALNAAAQLKAHLTVLNEENAGLKAERDATVAELEHAKHDLSQVTVDVHLLQSELGAAAAARRQLDARLGELDVALNVANTEIERLRPPMLTLPPPLPPLPRRLRREFTPPFVVRGTAAEATDVGMDPEHD